MNSIITLTTDFGLRDEYVGVMKGVILSRAPAAVIVDITHGIAGHNLVETAYLIDSVYNYFPKETVHVVVVDPGVGSDRKIITLLADGHIFLGPDNGIFTLLLRGKKFTAAYEVACSELYCQPLSSTFHGRDIMGPVAAGLARGLSPAETGQAVNRDDLITLSLPEITVVPEQGIISGRVVSVDGFGNLTTNITLEAIHRLTAGTTAERDMRIEINGKTCRGLHSSYNAVLPGMTVALIGSRNYLEIAANRESAAAILDAGVGDMVQIRVNLLRLNQKRNT